MPPAETSANERFQAVFQAEFAYVCTSLRRLGVNERDLEDVAHDLFVEVWKRFSTYDASRSARPWLFAFAFRFASDYRRLARHKVEVMVESDAEEGSPGADELIAKKDAQRMLLSALDSIDVERRAVFILFELDETPMPEIARSLGIPTNTAYSRLRLAREEFQAAAHRLAARRPTRPSSAAKEAP